MKVSITAILAGVATTAKASSDPTSGDVTSGGLELDGKYNNEQCQLFEFDENATGGSEDFQECKCFYDVFEFDLMD